MSSAVATYDLKGKTVSAFHGYRPVPSMIPVHKSKKLIDFVCGGYRAGKTYGLAKDVIDRVTEANGNVWAVVRQHYTDIVGPGGALDTYKRALADVQGIVVAPFHGTEHHITLRSRDGGTCRLWFASGDDPESFGSFEFGGAHIIEVSECREALLDMLVSRLSKQGVTHKIFCDLNPTDQFSWVYRRAIVQAGTDVGFFRVPTIENEQAGNLPEGYCARQIRLKGEAWATRYLDGHWGFTGEGEAVFPVFSRSRHLTDLKMLRDVPLVVGLDFGFRRPAAVIGQVQGSGLIVFDAILGQDEAIEQFADKVMMRVQEMGHRGTVEWWGDAAGDQVRDTDGASAIGLLSRRGIHVRGEKHRINAGIDVVRSMLTTNCRGTDHRLMFHSDCAELILYGMEGGYHYPEKIRVRDGGTDPLPEKDGVYDHLMDALRYLIVGLFGKDGSSNAMSCGSEFMSWYHGQVQND